MSGFLTAFISSTPNMLLTVIGGRKGWEKHQLSTEIPVMGVEKAISFN